MYKGSEAKQIALAKLDIIKSGVDTASHKVSKEKLEKAADWLKEIHEQVKKLRKHIEENFE